MRFFVGRTVGIGLLLLALAIPTAAAASVLDDSKTPVGDVIRPIFEQVVWVSLVIGVIVEALLIYALIRFRRRKDGPSEGVQSHGNTKLEIAWTIAPALVLAWLLVISYNGLVAIEGAAAPEPDFTIEVVGSQWQWAFVYPDGTRVNDRLRVQEDQVVGLIVHSVDVIHAFRVTELDVMVDAIPGKDNYVWFLAREPGEFSAACFQFCGTAHGTMLATVEVFPAGSQATPWGDPPAPEPDPADNDTAPPPSGNETQDNQTEVPENIDATVDVSMKDFRFAHPSVEPFRFEPGQTIEFKLTNDDSTTHNMFIGTYSENAAEQVVLASSSDLAAGGAETFYAMFPDETTTLDVWCNVPGHAKFQGMITQAGIGQDASGPSGVGEDPILPGPPVASLLVLLLGAVLLLRRRA